MLLLAQWCLNDFFPRLLLVPGSQLVCLSVSTFWAGSSPAVVRDLHALGRCTQVRGRLYSASSVRRWSRVYALHVLIFFWVSATAASELLALDRTCETIAWSFAGCPTCGCTVRRWLVHFCRAMAGLGLWGTTIGCFREAMACSYLREDGLLGY
jgi:hypothetical protein